MDSGSVTAGTTGVADTPPDFGREDLQAGLLGRDDAPFRIVIAGGRRAALRSSFPVMAVAMKPSRCIALVFLMLAPAARTAAGVTATRCA